jgi:hypothetical protein
VLVELSSPAALVAAAIFVFAAAAKLSSRATTRAAVSGFGLPTFVAPALAPIELVTASLLLWKPRVGGVFAALLLLAFTGVVVQALRRGVAVRCGCFGGTDKRPAGSDTVVRNGLLLVLVLIPTLGVTSLRRPTLPACLTLGSLCVTALMVVALVRVRNDLGTLFGQALPAHGDHP